MYLYSASSLKQQAYRHVAPQHYPDSEPTSLYFIADCLLEKQQIPMSVFNLTWRGFECTIYCTPACKPLHHRCISIARPTAEVALGTDHLTWKLEGGDYGFLFRSKEYYLYFLSCKVQFFFQNLTLGYMTKTESNFFLFPPPKSEYFFRKKP